MRAREQLDLAIEVIADERRPDPAAIVQRFDQVVNVPDACDTMRRRAVVGPEPAAVHDVRRSGHGVLS